MRGKKETLWIEDTPMFKDQRHEEPANREGVDKVGEEEN